MMLKMQTTGQLAPLQWPEDIEAKKVFANEYASIITKCK